MAKTFKCPEAELREFGIPAYKLDDAGTWVTGDQAYYALATFDTQELISDVGDIDGQHAVDVVLNMRIKNPPDDWTEFRRILESNLLDHISETDVNPHLVIDAEVISLLAQAVTKPARELVQSGSRADRRLGHLLHGLSLLLTTQVLNDRKVYPWERRLALLEAEIETWLDVHWTNSREE